VHDHDIFLSVYDIVINRDTVSPLSPLPPPSHNQAQNEDHISGGSMNNEDITSTSQQVSPPKTVSICAQKPECGG
jgi:hypothetical protein